MARAKETRALTQRELALEMATDALMTVLNDTPYSNRGQPAD